MSLTRIQKAACVAGQRMANHKTPFIFNEWYIAALSHEVSRELMSRTILGKSLVFYRKQDGTPVALSNRCGHRSFPLAKSTLDGDDIICGYHGMRYNEHGDVTEIPSQASCAGISIRNYPLVQRGPVIWIWMGDADKADPEKIPAL
ncbi:MAG: Rieske 2Fe-2S domain-containing protein, partial [Oceanobacter sp.]